MDKRPEQINNRGWNQAPNASHNRNSHFVEFVRSLARKEAERRFLADFRNSITDDIKGISDD